LSAHLDESDFRVAAVERRSWIITALFLAVSLGWRSLPVSLGILAGAVLAVVNFRWLRRFVLALAAAGRKPSRWAVFFYILKYLITGVAIFLLIKYDLADAVALLAGVSVIFLAICWEGIRAHRNVREGADHATDI